MNEQGIEVRFPRTNANFLSLIYKDRRLRNDGTLALHISVALTRMRIGNPNFLLKNILPVSILLSLLSITLWVNLHHNSRQNIILGKSHLLSSPKTPIPTLQIHNVPNHSPLRR